VGRRFRPGPDAPWLTVVGVVENMRRQGLESDPSPQIFEAIAQNPPRLATLLVRTAGNPMAMAGAVEAAVRAVDRSAPVYGAATLESRMASQLARRRLDTSLVTGFSAVALLMAAIGIYGLIQYSITARTREIGIRMAIGARPAGIFGMILREGLALCGIGMALGLIGAMWIGRAASGFLFGIKGTDPLTFAGAALTLLMVAAVACCAPARRAMRIEPTMALRQE
jgi:ABC-type antimicrobial peptide transport system permease subunit